MATQRYISTSFWDDAWIRTLDPSEKFVYLYLMTNPLTNIAGVYEITIDRICFDTGYNQETVQKVLNRFEQSKKVYTWNNFVILPSWPKHQRWQKRSKIEAGIVAILQELPQELLNFLKKIRYTYPIDTLLITYTYVRNYSDADTDLNSDTDADSKPDTAPNTQPVDNSETEHPDVSPEEVRAAAADVLDLRLRDADARTAAKSLSAHKLDAAFVRWAAEEVKKRENIKSPAGFLKKMLLALDDYADMIERYQEKPPERAAPKRASPPATTCPHCSGKVREIGSEIWCNSCKRLLWEYDEDFDIWSEPAEADASGW